MAKPLTTFSEFVYVTINMNYVSASNCSLNILVIVIHSLIFSCKKALNAKNY